MTTAHAINCLCRLDYNCLCNSKKFEQNTIWEYESNKKNKNVIKKNLLKKVDRQNVHSIPCT